MSKKINIAVVSFTGNSGLTDVYKRQLLLPVAIFRVLRELLKLLIQRDYQLAGTTYHAFVDALLMRSGPRR